MNTKIALRIARLEDVDKIVTLERKVWDGNGATTAMIESRIKAFPDGAIVALKGDAVVGTAFYQLIDSRKMGDCKTWYDFTDNGLIKATHTANGDVLFGISLTVDLDERQQRIGTKLSIRVAEKAVEHNVKKGIMGARVPYYHKCKDLPIEEYVNLKDASGNLVDPELRLYKRLGLNQRRIVPNYFTDFESLNYGVLFEWKNPFYRRVKRSNISRYLLAKTIGTYYRLKFS